MTDIKQSIDNFILFHVIQLVGNKFCYFTGAFEKNEEQFDQQSSDVDESGEIGGLFRIISRDQQKLKVEPDSMDIIESSLLIPWSTKVENFTHTEVYIYILFNVL